MAKSSAISNKKIEIDKCWPHFGQIPTNFWQTLAKFNKKWKKNSSNKFSIFWNKKNEIREFGTNHNYHIVERSINVVPWARGCVLQPFGAENPAKDRSGNRYLKEVLKEIIRTHLQPRKSLKRQKVRRSKIATRAQHSRVALIAHSCIAEIG